MLKPGGILVLSTPQRFSPLELAAKIAFLPGIIAIVRWIYKEPVLDSGHINLMTRKRLERELEDAGFMAVRSELTGMYIPLVAEFLGQAGLTFEKWLARHLNNTAFSWLLWTQYHVVRKPFEDGHAASQRLQPQR